MALKFQESFPNNQKQSAMNLFGKIDEASRQEDEERIGKYKIFLNACWEIFSEDEQKEIIDQPIDFTSQTYLFRGLPFDGLIELAKNKILVPQSGQFGRKAVFATDSLFLASDFIDNNGGSLIVLDKDKIAYADPKIKIWNMDSIDFTKTITEAINMLRQAGTENNDILYTAYNNFDTSENYSPNHPWHMIALSQSQPISAIKQIIIANLNDKIVQKFNPEIIDEDLINNIIGNQDK